MTGTPTSKIELRDVEDDDLAIFFEHQQDADAVHMAAFTKEDPSDRQAFDDHWARIRTNETVMIKSVLVDGAVAGHVASFERDGQLEVTYWLGQQHWGQGIATRALTAFLHIQTTRPIRGGAAKDNIASIRVLEKCGFKHIGYAKGFANARGKEIEETLMILE